MAVWIIKLLSFLLHMYNFVFNIYSFMIFCRKLDRTEIRPCCVLDIHKQFEVFTNVGKTMAEQCCKVSVAINKIRAHYASPILFQEQLLQNKLHDIENIEVKVHPSFHEVTALYQIDDTKLKLNITLSPNHLLEPALSVNNTQTERIFRQLSVFPTHQVIIIYQLNYVIFGLNNQGNILFLFCKSIYDEFVLWRRSLDKKFVGVEECCICFSIFHRNTCQIPKISCHTCRKKYHSVCLVFSSSLLYSLEYLMKFYTISSSSEIIIIFTFLFQYKWFNTNQKPSCPMCRDTIMCWDRYVMIFVLRISTFIRLNTW